MQNGMPKPFCKDRISEYTIFSCGFCRRHQAKLYPFKPTTNLDGFDCTTKGKAGTNKLTNWCCVSQRILRRLKCWNPEMYAMIWGSIKWNRSGGSEKSSCVGRKTQLHPGKQLQFRYAIDWRGPKTTFCL